MHNFSLRTKIVGIAILISTITLSSAFSVITYIAREQAYANAMTDSQIMASGYAKNVEKELAGSSSVVNSLTSTVLAMKQSGTPDRALAQEIAKSVLNSNQQLIGLSSYWEPDAFDGKDAEWIDKPGHDKTGRFMAYWNRSSGKIAVDATVDYDIEEKSPWYFIPKKTGKFFVTDPYNYPIGGKDVLMISLMSPIIENSKFLGVSGLDYPLSYLQGVLDKVKPFDSGYAALISQNGIYASHPDTSKLGKLADDLPKEVLDSIKNGKTTQAIKDGIVDIYQPVQIGTSDIYWVDNSSQKN